MGAELRRTLRSDLHCHTTWSDGGAIGAGHGGDGHEPWATTTWPSPTTPRGSPWPTACRSQRLADQLAEIDELRDELAPFRILTGMEVDILPDGTLDLPEDSLARLDVVVASVHSKLRMDREAMTERMVRAVASPHVDILGHCTGRRITGTRRPPSDFDAEIVFAACARFGTAVEVNCRPERRDPPGDLLDLADQWGCLFAIDTDAHAPGQMEWQNWGCDLVTEHGIDPARIVNTWAADDLLEWAGSHAVA